MIENILGNRRKFRALYLDQSVFWHISDGVKLTRRPLHVCLDSHGYLELIPLSQITDEDAIEVSRIFRWNYYSDEAKIAQVKNFLFENLDYHSTNISANEYFKALDFLRSRGYALPWMGILVETMVEWGWIQLKNN